LWGYVSVGPGYSRQFVADVRGGHSRRFCGVASHVRNSPNRYNPLGARGHFACLTRKTNTMKRKPSRKPHVLDRKRTGKYSEASKGPFARDIVMRMYITIHGVARKPWTTDKVREELTTYFGEYFGPRTLRNVASDAIRRMLLVERMVNRVAEIRAGQKPLTPLWN
jgi:hypothetical protein